MSRNSNGKIIDEIDIEIINLMTHRKSNKEISQSLKVPLSTIQRRVRNLTEKGLVTFSVDIDYQMFGFKTGLLYIYLRNGETDETAKKILALKQVTSVEIHIGNADIVGHTVYKDGKELLNLIGVIKNIEAIERVTWSERIYQTSHKIRHNLGDILNN